MEGCPWGQARAGRRRESAGKVAGGQGKVASGQGKVAGFVSICMFCVFHIGLNGIKSRGGWPTWPWQPCSEQTTHDSHQKDGIYFETSGTSMPNRIALACTLRHPVCVVACVQSANQIRRESLSPKVKDD